MKDSDKNLVANKLNELRREVLDLNSHTTQALCELSEKIFNTITYVETFSAGSHMYSALDTQQKVFLYQLLMDDAARDEKFSELITPIAMEGFSKVLAHLMGNNDDTNPNHAFGKYSAEKEMHPVVQLYRVTLYRDNVLVMNKHVSAASEKEALDVFTCIHGSFVMDNDRAVIEAL
jgi:hypothetical protein